jgi:hypothetical protein
LSERWTKEDKEKREGKELNRLGCMIVSSADLNDKDLQGEYRMERRCTKRNHPNSLKNAKPTRHNPNFIPPILLRHIRTLTHHGKYNNNHTYECQGRSFSQFGDVSVEGKGIGDECCAEDDDYFAVYEY